MRTLASAVTSFVLMLALFIPSIGTAPTPVTRYLPLIAQNATLAPFPPMPAKVDVTLPFTCLDSDEPDPVYQNGYWYFNCYRVDSGDLNGAWDMYWRPDMAAAVALEKLTPSDNREAVLPAIAPAAVTPIGLVCSARIDQVVAPDNERYSWCFVSTSGRTRNLRIERRPQAKP